MIRSAIETGRRLASIPYRWMQFGQAANGSNPAIASALAATTLEFVARKQPEGYVAAALRLYDVGKRHFVLQAPDESLPLAREVQARIAAQRPNATCTLEICRTATKPRRLSAAVTKSDAVLLLESRADLVSARLLDFVDLPVSIVAPLSEHHYQRRAVYAITVPKSGTHMLFGLLTAFNLINGGEGREPLSPQHYYQAMPGNSHTQAREFFRMLRGRPQGGSDHPLFVTPTLFLYRNPLDVLVSEAFYYQDCKKTSLAHYFASLDIEAMILRLISDDPLVRSVRRRMRAYLPWLSLPNVIPVSFEELVGPQGGGSLEEQLKTIWSLQLKLHVPGSPAYFAAALYRRDSKTFRKGAINSHLEHFSERCRAAFAELDQDFMQQFGYDLNDDYGPAYIPRFVDHFRRRPLVLGQMATTAEKPDASDENSGPAADAVYACHGYLAAGVGGIYCAQPASAPRPVDARLSIIKPHVHVAPTWDQLVGQLAADPLTRDNAEPRIVPGMCVEDLFVRDPALPILAAADVCGFNIVQFKRSFYCLEIKRGHVDVQFDDLSDVFVAPTADEARAYCQSQRAGTQVAAA